MGFIVYPLLISQSISKFKKKKKGKGKIMKNETKKNSKK